MSQASWLQVHQESKDSQAQVRKDWERIQGQVHKDYVDNSGTSQIDAVLMKCSVYSERNNE